jgi:hypothetical protein
MMGRAGFGSMPALAGESVDRDFDLRLSHQPAVVDNSKQKASQHEADRHFDARSSCAVGGVAAPHLGAQPGEIEEPVTRARM